MALVYADRVMETTTTTGTGAVTLAGAVTGHRTFGAALSDGDTTYYTIESADLSAWEVGIGTYTASGTTLSRDTVLASTNSNAAVSFGSGTKRVFVTAPARALHGIPSPGDVKMGAYTTPDPGWLLCDGLAISRTTYAALFAKISTTYGAGDGSTTFNIPDYRGVFPVGAVAGGDYDLGDTGGAESIALTTGEMPSHSHSFNASDTFDAGETSLSGNYLTAYDGTAAQSLVNTTSDATANSGTIGSAGSGDAHENRPPFLAINFFIKT